MEGKEHFYGEYDTRKRFMSYWYQVKEVLGTNPQSVLEIGIGNGFVSNYLKDRGIEVTTVDVNEELDPDVTEDVRHLTDSFDTDSFDTVLCAEVLEHLPFDDFEGSVSEIEKVCRDEFVLSLPHFGANFSLSFKLPLVDKKRFGFKIPFPKEHEVNEHKWEIGKRGYPLSEVTEVLSSYFSVERTYCPVENMYHQFFVLSTGENKRLSFDEREVKRQLKGLGELE